MRFLIGADVPRDPNSGAAGTVFWTNQALRELGHEVDEIWCNDLPHRIKHGNLHCLLELPRAYCSAIRDHLASASYDVIIVSQPHAFLAACENRRRKQGPLFINRSHGLEPRVAAAVAYWRKKIGMPANRFPRSVLSPIMQAAFSRQWHPLIKNCDGFLVQCTDDFKYLTRELGAPDHKVSVISHGLTEPFRKKPVDFDALPERLGRLLHVAQFSFFKGQYLLAKSVDTLLAKHAQLTFTWVCAKKDHAAAASLFDDAVRNRVFFEDRVSQDALIDVYDRHGVFLFSSLAEGGAKTCLEAMSRGLPVVSANNSGMKDYILNGVNGCLVDTGNVDSFCQATERLLTDPPFAVRLAKAAYSDSQSYTWKRAAQETVDFVGTL